jgi:hypothetical protein
MICFGGLGHLELTRIGQIHVEYVFFPECGAKGSRLTVGVWGPGVCSLAVSACDRARALWQGRWGTLPKGVWVGGREGREEGGGRMGTKRGIRVRGFVLFAFLGLPKKQIQKSKSNTRAEIEGNVCLREKNRAHAGGSPPVPPSGSSDSGAYFIH